MCIAKTKMLVSCAVTAQLICGFVFAYANCWFSDVVAQILLEPLCRKLSIKNLQVYLDFYECLDVA